MKIRKYYKVGGHIFSIEAEEQVFGELNFKPYSPFEVSESEQLFSVEIVEDLSIETIEDVIVNAPLSSDGMPQVDIYRTGEGFLYNVTMPYSDIINASIAVDEAEHKVRVSLSGAAPVRSLAFNNAVILSFISFAMEHSTMLLHSSTVICEGRAYLFLGKSGTGKSTHSRMWLEAFEEAELLNDDHPIVRYYDDGSVVVFGSPWSGKTPCYRNLSAPLGGIVRISRAENNMLEKLRPLKAFASLTTSCSGVQWSQKLLDEKVRTIESIVQSTSSYIMHCLPDVDAASVCYKGIKENQ